MVGKEDFKKKAKEMAEKARAKAQREKAEKTGQPEKGESGSSGFQPSETAEKLKKEHGEGPERW